MQAFNIDNAVKYARKCTTTQSTHKCAHEVRLMLEAGGLNTTGRPNYAKDYLSFLPKLGFSQVISLNTRTDQSTWTSQFAKPGDIAVMNNGQYGHICMFDGKDWVSDFRQSRMWVYKGDGTVNIFRFNG